MTEPMKALGKLISLNDSKIKNSELYQENVSIGRFPTNNIVIDDNRVSGKHCELLYENGSWMISDLSTNGTFIQRQKIGKGNKISINTGDQFYLLIEGNKIPQSDVIGFVFIGLQQSDKSTKQESYEVEQISKKPKLDDFYIDEFSCTICSEIFYQPVSLIPCLHNFCGCCLSNWLKKEKTCPVCRKVVESARKNTQICNLLQIYLNQNPQKQRTESERKQMDQENIIQDGKDYNHIIPQNNRVIPIAPQRIYSFFPEINYHEQYLPPIFAQFQQRINEDPSLEIHNRLIQINQNSEADNSDSQQELMDQREEDDDEEEEEEEEEDEDEQYYEQQNENIQLQEALKLNLQANRKNCLQCRDTLCVQGQRHVGCSTCGRDMPDLNLGNSIREVYSLDYAANQDKKHKCEFCQKFFCNIINGNLNCNQNRYVNLLFSFKDHWVPNLIQLNMVRNNFVEFNKIQQALKIKIMTFKDIFNYMVQNYININMFHIVADDHLYRRLKRKFEFPLTLETPFCKVCWQEVLFQILLRYCIINREDVGNGHLIDCWYGVNCISNNPAHQEEYNHLCEQTRF